MGYDFFGYKKEGDETSIFHCQCQYAFEALFKKAFGHDVRDFSGKVNYQMIEKFTRGLIQLKQNKGVYEQELTNLRGNISSRPYDFVISELTKLRDLMLTGGVTYISID